jgi:predicted RNA-binding protein with EMAP domain
MLAQKQVQQITDAVLSTKFRTKRDALAAIDNLEKYPLTAALFEKGYLSAENVQDSQYVSAMEKSLRQKQERLGSLKQNPTRTSAPASYMRTMVTPQPGIYAYKRPRFDTAPLYSY